MSVEIVLIPVAIALTKEVAEGISRRLEHKDKKVVILETRMKDEALLRLALDEWECSLLTVGGLEEVQFTSSAASEVIFTVNEEGRYALVLPGTADQAAYKEWITNVEQSYTRHLQQMVYRNLMEQAKSRGLIFEQEERLEDQSIQITFALAAGRKYA